MVKTKISKPESSSMAPSAPSAIAKRKTKNKKRTTHKFKSKPKLKSKSKISTPSSSASSDSEPEPANVRKLLELYSREQLIDLAADAAVSSSTLFAKIREFADKDVSHRKIFVHGLSWETTNETLISKFKKFGEIENCNLVLDRVTGKSKGYGFVTFKTRKSAWKALEEPRMEIDNRVVVWQLASLGPPSNQGQQQDGNGIGIGIGIGIGSGNLSERKIYVNNVPSDVSADKLRTFFAKFGEIENGPMGFDVQTGKFKGYALFVYKSVEGAKKALEEPYKVFDGMQLHCQKAAQGKKNSGGAAGITTAVQPVPPIYAAMAAQNMALYGQNPGVNVNSGLLSVNPLYSSLLANANAVAAAAGLVNMSSLGSFQQGGVGMGMGIDVGGYGGLLGHALSNIGSGSGNTMFGAYDGSSGSSAPMPLGLQYAYPNAPIGQEFPAAPPPGTSGTGAQLSYKK